ncbi:MAG: response regulator [Sandaracinaceae bacterium]|nr:response regulator [Sandaracinaceae bacterium]
MVANEPDPARVLFVDDEPHVLEAIERLIGDEFDVITATSGSDGLGVLRAQGPFHVVCSDMRMPHMDGATFLTRARDEAPDTIRLLLTGQAEIEAAVAAVNQGRIFRFLCKPCPEPVLRGALRDALEQHRLIHAERELLESTLNATIRLLCEILGLVSPQTFARTATLRRLVSHAATTLMPERKWELEAAASLSVLGLVALPQALVDRWLAGGRLTEAEQNELRAHPELAARLIAPIPRLGHVAELVRRQALPLRGEPTNELEVALVLLQTVLAVDLELARGKALPQAIERQAAGAGHAVREVLRCLADVRGAPTDQAPVRAVALRELAPGMVALEDVTTLGGMMLLPSGKELTAAAIERLRHIARQSGVREPLRVRLPA